MPSLFDDLAAAIARRQVLVVVGAGVSIGATCNQQTASWTGLLEHGTAWVEERVPGLPAKWGDRVRDEIASGDVAEMLSAAEKVTERLGGREHGQYRGWLKAAFEPLNADAPESIEAFRALKVPIATTNYDGLLEQVLGARPVTWRDSAKARRVVREHTDEILHLHGFWDEPKSVVLGIRSYERVLGHRPAQALQGAMATMRSLLFVGFGAGLSDPNFGALRTWMSDVWSDSEFAHYRLVRDGERDRVAATHDPDERIEVIGYGTDHDDLAGFLTDLAQASVGQVLIAHNSTAQSSTPDRDDGSGASNHSTAEGGSGRAATVERIPWDDLAQNRPRISTAVDPDEVHIGHEEVRQELRSRLAAAETAEIVMLTGSSGSGKTSSMRWFGRQAGRRVVDAGAVSRNLVQTVGPRALRPDGEDLGELWGDQRPAVTTALDNPVLLFDNVDHLLREEGINRLIHEAITELDVGLIVVSMSTAITRQLFPIPVSQLSLHPRQATEQEFGNYMDRVLDGLRVPRDAFSKGLRDSLFSFSEHTADFRAIQYVMEQLVALYEWRGGRLYPAQLRLLLEDDPAADQLNRLVVRTPHEPRLVFRPKDKTERLAEVLGRHFVRQELIDTANAQLRVRDGAAFLAELDRPFHEAVLTLCFTHSPRDLVLLLPPDVIREELSDLGLDPQRFVDDRTEAAELLVRGLGFTLVDPPAGLRAFEDAVRRAKELVDRADPGVDVLRGAGHAVLEHVETALLNLLSYWSSRLLDPVDDLLQVAYMSGEVRKPFRSRLTPEAITRLLRMLNHEWSSEASSNQLDFTDTPVPVPPALLNACAELASAAETFDRIDWSSARGESFNEVEASCRRLLSAAADVLQASDDTYPSVIKLSEIRFDEFSRKVFRGIDSEDKPVRFAFTDEADGEDLVVARQYFLLPRKSVLVNPRIGLRAGRTIQVQFRRPDQYDASSFTQHQQALRLLELSQLRHNDEVVDIGCRTGAFTLDVAARVKYVHGIDRSPEMIERAESRARQASTTNVRFELADLLEYEANRQFDAAISNATMHWILPSRRAYRKLFALIRRGGRLAVHQGGNGNYRGLHAYTRDLLRELDFEDLFHGWRYPIYYPTKRELQDLLYVVGLESVVVESVEDDGSEYPDLIRDFSEAGLLPYLERLPEVHREWVRSEWLADAERSRIDLYTNRLYAVAVRP